MTEKIDNLESVSDQNDFDPNKATARELAQYCMDSAAIMHNPHESPERFWGATAYGRVVDRAEQYINEIGLEKARELFKKKKLDFPGSITGYEEE